ncbi:toxin co-regulated pilus biosynthesis Q family protein [Serratia nevei]|uniref:toxin co-regulated pilus biosynthesis Q family protein n=1 Tax=Serratia nevei TaxID=2703794 RepID=UPI003F7767DD
MMNGKKGFDMRTKKIILVGLIANALSACSSPPKLSEPEGDWVSFEPVISQSPVRKTYQSGTVDVVQQPMPIVTTSRQRNSGKTDFVKADGKHVPLYTAVRTIVPESWNVKLSPDVSQRFRGTVSWTGNDQWPYVLQRMLEANKLNALVDWKNSRVSIAFAEKPVEKVLPEVKTPTPDKLLKPTIQSKARDTTSPGGGDAKVGKNPFTLNTTKKPDVPVKKSQPVRLPVWRGEVGSTLKDTVFRWSASQTCTEGGNWRVIWDTPVNYHIDAPLRFEGDFKTALNGIFGLYQYAQKPLYAFTNSTQCLIKVTDKG